MSSKALTLTAAIASACAVALGQTTSQNVVGYINIDLTANQYALIANQLDNGKGNKVGDLLAGVPENTTIAKFLNSKGGFEAANTYVGGEWDTPAQTLAPGEGAFIKAPSATKITFVGEVKQGASSVPLRSGYSMISSVVPQEIDLEKVADYGLKPNENDVVVQFVGGKYLGANTYAGGTFDPGKVAVGSAFWYLNTAKTAGSWDRTFNVQ